MELSSLGSGTAGIWTRAEALHVVSAQRIRTFLQDGTWRVVLPGVYADGGYESTAEQRALAAVLVSGGSTGQPLLAAHRHLWRAVAAGRTAARIWRLPLVDDDDPTTGARGLLHDDVVVRGARDALVSGGRHVHRWQWKLEADDVTRRASGLLVTTIARTLSDCARLLTREALVCAIDDALHRGWVTSAGLRSYAAQQGGRPGAPAFRDAIGAADARAESPHETLVRLLLLPALPQLRPQVRLLDGGRTVARFDLADEAARFAVEADGRAGHAGDVMAARDRRRDSRTAARGWHTERVTWWEVRRAPERTRAQVVSAYARHLRRTA